MSHFGKRLEIALSMKGYSRRKRNLPYEQLGYRSRQVLVNVFDGAAKGHIDRLVVFKRFMPDLDLNWLVTGKGIIFIVDPKTGRSFSPDGKQTDELGVLQEKIKGRKELITALEGQIELITKHIEYEKERKGKLRLDLEELEEKIEKLKKEVWQLESKKEEVRIEARRWTEIVNSMKSEIEAKEEARKKNE